MSQANAHAMLQSMEAYSRGDYDTSLALFHPAIEWRVEDDLVPDAATYHGHQGVLDFWSTWGEAFDRIRLEVEQCRVISDDRVLIITRAVGTGSGSGAEVESSEFGQLVDFVDGQVVRVRLFGNISRAW